MFLILAAFKYHPQGLKVFNWGLSLGHTSMTWEWLTRSRWPLQERKQDLTPCWNVQFVLTHEGSITICWQHSFLKGQGKMKAKEANPVEILLFLCGPHICATGEHRLQRKRGLLKILCMTFLGENEGEWIFSVSSVLGLGPAEEQTSFYDCFSIPILMSRRNVVAILTHVTQELLRFCHISAQHVFGKNPEEACWILSPEDST